MTGFPKPRPRVLDRRASAREKAENWKRVCAAVTKRDKVCVVCCGRGNHHHHIVYRSHGGEDTVENVVLTCLDCHRDIHAHVVLVTFDPLCPSATFDWSRNTTWDKESA